MDFNASRPSKCIETWNLFVCNIYLVGVWFLFINPHHTHSNALAHPFHTALHFKWFSKAAEFLNRALHSTPLAQFARVYVCGKYLQQTHVSRKWFTSESIGVVHNTKRMYAKSTSNKNWCTTIHKQIIIYIESIKLCCIHLSLHLSLRLSWLLIQETIMVNKSSRINWNYLFCVWIVVFHPFLLKHSNCIWRNTACWG